MVTAETTNRRIFNKEPYYTDKVVYSSKEEAKSLISEIKSFDRTVKARIVEKSGGVYVYYDEKSFSNIKNGKFRNLIHRRKSSIPVIIPTKIRTKANTNTRKDPTKSTNSVPPKPTISIIERQERLPQFLMKRLSNRAATILQKSVLEPRKTSKKELEVQLDIIRSEQVKFDTRFEHEKQMLDYINRVARIIEKRIQEYEEQEAEIFIRVNIIAPINRGEFKKQLSKLENKGVDEVAYMLYRKLGRKVRKYPYSESRLQSQIRNFLTEHF